jgi:hypothetical protein
VTSQGAGLSPAFFISRLSPLSAKPGHEGFPHTLPPVGETRYWATDTVFRLWWATRSERIWALGVGGVQAAARLGKDMGATGFAQKKP